MVFFLLVTGLVLALRSVTIFVVLAVWRVVFEDFLSMGAYLSANSCCNVLRDFLPIFAIHIDS